jgi:DHA3 family macrolide efflux protein-like MFS transporter
MIVSDAAIALLTGALAVLYWLDVARPWHVYLILFMRAVGDTVHSPTMRATTPLMVPKDQLTRVAGMNQILDGIVKIAIPPAGALLLVLLPMGSILAIDVITALLAIVPLVLTHIPQPKASQRLDVRQQRGRPSLLCEISEGMRYVWSWRGLFLLIVTSALIQLSVAPAAALLPLWVTQHLNGEALHLGWINSAFGIGIVAGGLGLSLWGGFKRRIVTSQLGTFGVGVGLLAMGLTPSGAFGLALGGMLLVGLMMPVYSAPRLAIYQSAIPPEMQGRFFTLNDSLLQVMAPLGLAVSGPLSDLLGVRTWIALAGVSCMVIGLARALIPCIRQIEDRVPA